jgi:hypothetical protein
VKTISGVQVRACTLGTTRTFSVIVDGVVKGTFPLTTSLDDPLDYTWMSATPIEGVEFRLSVDSLETELWSWSPLITARRPLGVLTWDSGPIDLGSQELVWLRRIDLSARATRAITVDTYLDGVLLATQTSGPVPQLPGTTGTDTVIPIDLPRGTKGRQPRLVVRSSGRFHPRWIKVTRRTSGQSGEKPVLTVPVTLGEQPQGVA